MSAEKREGTIGLLFLTDLKGYDVVLGKFAASSMNSFYGLLAVVPMLALALLLGGVTGSELARVGALLINTLFFSLAAGLFVSTISQNERKAMFGTIGLIILAAFGPYGVANYYTYGFQNMPFSELNTSFLIPSPYFAFNLTRQTAIGGWMVQEFFNSIWCTHLMSWSLLGLSSIILPRICHDRPKSAKRLRWGELLQQWSYGNSAARKAFRTRMLDHNPFFWLAGRDRVKANLVWLFLGLMGVLWYWGYSEYRDLIFEWYASAWMLFFVHSFLKIWFTSEVCCRLVEDRRSGALELLLTSPLKVSQIIRGQHLALRRQFGKPLIVVLIIDLLLLMNGVNSWGYFVSNDAKVITFLAGMFMLVADLMTLKWVGMWHALTAQGTNRAILATALRVLALPWIIYFGVFLICGIRSVILGTRVPFETLVFYWFGISLATNLFFGLQARKRLCHEFREVAVLGSDPKSQWLSDVFPARQRHVVATPVKAWV